MNLEVGKRYLARNGATFLIVAQNTSCLGTLFEFDGIDMLDQRRYCWSITGNFTGCDSPLDLVQEATQFIPGKSYVTRDGQKLEFHFENLKVPVDDSRRLVFTNDNGRVITLFITGLYGSTGYEYSMDITGPWIESYTVSKWAVSYFIDGELRVFWSKTEAAAKQVIQELGVQPLAIVPVTFTFKEGDGL